MLNNKILIVEDDNKIKTELTAMIKTMGYEVNSVKVNNKLGLKAATADNPELIIIDSKYKIINGTCPIVADILKNLNIPILYYNSDAEIDLPNLSFNNDDSDQIFLPVEERRLNIAIEIALYKHSMDLRIKESEARFKSLVENSSIGIFRLSREGRILHGNPIFLKLLGYNDLKEIIGTNLGKFLENQDDKMSVLDLVDETGNVCRRKIELKNRNDEKFIISLGGNLVKWEDEILYFDGTVEDITKQVIYEQQLIEAKEKAEESDRLKTEFLAGMSHEIRSPINTIMNYISLLEEELNPSTNEELKEIFDAIEIGSFRLTRTIDSILNMSQFQSGTFDTFKTKIDLIEEILKNLYQEFKCTAQQRGLKLYFSNSADSTSLLGDKYSLSQLFVNLIDNGLKYTKEGSVSINVYNDEDGILSVDVEDTGIGISTDFLPTLFKPFTQEEQGYTRKFDGSGLGLALVKKYCELNEGIISVNSVKGKGTKFTVKFTQTNKNNAYNSVSKQKSGH